MFEESLNKLESNVNKSITTHNQQITNYKKTKNDFLLLREYYSNSFGQVISDLNLIINHITNENKKVEDNEESPASKVTSLNLNWINVPGITNENQVSNKICSGSYWCAKTEEVLDGAFICRIQIEFISENPPDWHHGAGIIKANKDSIMESYYSYSCLFLSSGIFTKQFQGANGENYGSKWKTGDEIIIKRDFDDDLWFGLNDENSLKRYGNQPGSFRIVIGFLNSNKANEIFKITQLMPLGR